MRILGLTDIHGDISGLKKISKPLSEAGLVLLIGDITNFGREQEVRKVIDALGEAASQILAVSGNCDYIDVAEFLTGENIHIHGKGEVINGIGFVGAGGSIPTPFHTPNKISENKLKIILEKGFHELPPDVPFILVSHQPPINTTCDIIKTGVHVGSKSVRRFIENHQPLACITGHIHEAGGIDKIGNTPVVNPGPFFQGKYVSLKIGNGIDELMIQSVW